MKNLHSKSDSITELFDTLAIFYDDGQGATLDVLYDRLDHLYEPNPRLVTRFFLPRMIKDGIHDPYVLGAITLKLSKSLVEDMELVGEIPNLNGNKVEETDMLQIWVNKEDIHKVHVILPTKLKVVNDKPEIKLKKNRSKQYK